MAHIGLEVVHHALGENDITHQVLIAHGHVAVGLEGDPHVMTLLHKPPHGATHRDHHVVRVGAEDEHPLGVGLSALGAISVVGIWLAAWPSGDGVLQVVKYFDIDVVG